MSVCYHMIFLSNGTSSLHNVWYMYKYITNSMVIQLTRQDLQKTLSKQNEECEEMIRVRFD